MSANHLSETGARTWCSRALAAGATDAECTISEGEEFSANVRMREVETSEGSRLARRRTARPDRASKPGASYTSDLSREGIELMVRSAIDLARFDHAKIRTPACPTPTNWARSTADLELYSAETEGLEPGLKIDAAKRAEAAALDADPRIINSEGASFDAYAGRHVFANSRGFVGRVPFELLRCRALSPWRATANRWSAITGATPRADSPIWNRPSTSAAPPPSARLRRLNPVKVETQKVPVVFEPRTARTLLDSVCDAVHGMSIYRQRVVPGRQAGREDRGGNRDHRRRRHAFPASSASSPFDDEGVRSRRTPVIERGVLKSYLLNTYAARKLGMKTTGNASRGITGNAGIGHGNFYLEKGVQTPEEMIAGIANGFLRHGTDRLRREYRDRRLFARRRRAVDPQRRTGVRGFGSHHRRQPEGDADGDRDGRLRPGISRLDWPRLQ